MVEYPMILTDTQDAILAKIAASVGKTAAEVIEEQVAAQIKRTILTAYPDLVSLVAGESDAASAEIAAELALMK